MVTRGKWDEDMVPVEPGDSPDIEMGPVESGVTDIEIGELGCCGEFGFLLRYTSIKTRT